MFDVGRWGVGCLKTRFDARMVFSLSSSEFTPSSALFFHRTPVFPTMRTFIILIVFAVLGAGGWFYFRGDKDDAPQYQTAVVARGDLTQAVTATGTLNPVMNVQVGSQISGIIQKLSADFNSEVKAGEVIAQLDPATYQANVHQAEGELAQRPGCARDSRNSTRSGSAI
jgi:hypothetical protein